ncbi:hypothetical protein ACFW5I_34985 [Streptomyces sp. NPDC058818]|uniref:hypothetical protein n=1 Tax=Streptomyces sp. NPDC058818 TaxID=3346640 RepID=UPI0036792E0D
MLDETVPVDTGHDYDAGFRRLVDDRVHIPLASWSGAPLRLALPHNGWVRRDRGQCGRRRWAAAS